MTKPRWDDERLRRAYRDRFGGPAPSELARSVVDGLPIRHQNASRLLPAMTALAAVVAVAVGIGVVMSPGPFISPPRQPTASPTPPPLVDGFPAEVLGLPVISVSEAMALRDAGPDDTETAVRGYIPVPYPVPLSCPVELGGINPLGWRCGDLTAWLMEEPEPTWEKVESGFHGFPPTGPALQPVYRIEVPSAAADGFVPDQGEPVPVVLVGHFNDHRSLMCPDVAACRRQFVVDAREWVAGHEAGREVVRFLDRWDAAEEREMTLDPHLNAEQAIAIASGADGAPMGRPWVAALTSGYLEYVDPRAAEVPQLAAADVVWVVRELANDGGRPVARTMFVVDGTGELYRSRAAGIMRVSEVVEDPQLHELHARLVDPAGRDDVSVDVFDFSGTVVTASTGEVGPRDVEYANGLFVKNVEADLLQISWIGSRCDREHVLTISREGTRLLLARPARVCVLLPVERAMRIRFKAPVDAASLTARLILVPPREP